MPNEIKQCNTPCYDCRGFSTDYFKIKIENCKNCGAIYKAEKVQSKIRNDIPAAYQPDEDPHYEPPYASKFIGTWESRDVDFESLGYNSECECLSALHQKMKISEIARLTGCTYARIKNRLKFHNIALRQGIKGDLNPMAKAVNKKINDAIAKFDCDNEQGLWRKMAIYTYDQIRKEIGISRNCARDRSRKCGIARMEKPWRSA